MCSQHNVFSDGISERNSENQGMHELLRSYVTSRSRRAEMCGCLNVARTP